MTWRQPRCLALGGQRLTATCRHHCAWAYCQRLDAEGCRWWHQGRSLTRNYMCAASGRLSIGIDPEKPKAAGDLANTREQL